MNAYEAPQVLAPDEHSELGWSLIPADSRIPVAWDPNGGWRFDEGGAVSFGLDDEDRFTAWARQHGVDVTWPQLRQALVDHVVASEGRRAAQQQAAEAERERRRLVNEALGRAELEVITTGLWRVTLDGARLGFVVDRGTPGGGYWAIPPENDAHDVNTAPTVGGGRTPRVAAYGLVDRVLPEVEMEDGNVRD